MRALCLPAVQRPAGAVFAVIARLLRRLRSNAPAPTLTSLEAYARWAAAYPPRAHNALMEAEQSAMLELLPPLEGQRVLDLACGTGRYGLIALERGAWGVIGVDNSAEMLAACALKQRVLGTTERIPLPTESFDGVICGLALGHLPSLEASAREIGRVLKRGGWALISDVHPFLFLSGAQRTFSAGGRTYAVEHYPHSFADYVQAAHAAGLRLDAVREPRASGSLAPQVPVAVIYRLRKA